MMLLTKIQIISASFSEDRGGQLAANELPLLENNLGYRQPSVVCKELRQATQRCT